MECKKQTRNNQSTEKALQILELLAASKRPMRLSDIAGALGLNGSTCLRFLITLQNCGYVEQESTGSRYFPTLKICLVAGQIDYHTRLRSTVRPHLEAASRLFSESALLGILQDDEVLFLDSANESRRMLGAARGAGLKVPLHCTGMGKLFLSGYPADKLEEYIGKYGLPAHTFNTITDQHALRANLGAIREAGIGIDSEEFEQGARCVAAPVLRPGGGIVASIGISGPIARLDDRVVEQKAELLKEICREISTQLFAV